MRRGPVVLLLAAVLLPALAPPAAAHQIGYPGWTNFLLDRTEAPDLAPGESGTYSVVFNNSYPWNMTDIRLRFEVFRYRQLDLDEPVDPATWRGPGPSFVAGGVDAGLGIDWTVLGPGRTGLLRPGESEDVSFTVATDPDTPHGGITDQGSYFVRVRAEFTLTDGATTNRSLMMSKGFFTDAEFAAARLPDPSACPAGHYCEGGIDLTSLGSAAAVQARDPGRDHLDALLPDSGFSVRERIPAWPFFAVGGVTVASLVFAVLFYAEENPGKYPRLARAWMAVKGRARGVRPPRAK